jgi:cytidylate kinase
MNARKESAKTKEPVVICISGLAGSGKSTLAKRLAHKYGLRYYSGGDALKALASEQGYESIRHGWWESKEGMRFLEKRRMDPRFDEAVDRKLLELARRGNVVLDSWTMPWLLKKAFRIWLDASPEKRAGRIAKRDRISAEEALEALRRKERQTRAIYRKIYGFNLGEDFAPFYVIMDTSNLTAEEVFQVLCTVMDNMVLDLGNC